MDKPIKPTETLAESFGGLKENFTEDKIETGYQPDVPDILAGTNLNYLLDTIGKKFKYNDTISDYIKNMPIGKTINTDEYNNLIYSDLLHAATVLEEKNNNITSASITPYNLYRLNGFRLANTEYKVGDTVSCPYHHNFQLSCIIAGVTSSEVLDTSGEITLEQQIVDGSVVWQIISSVSSLGYEVYGEIEIIYPEGLQ